MVIKTADSKGRITLGSEAAGRTFLVRTEAGRILLEPAVVIPAREAWLYENTAALQSVQRGLEQARSRQFSAGPQSFPANRH